MHDIKAIRIIAVKRSERPIQSYAQELEDAMNSLQDVGYSVALRDDPDGVLVIGELLDDEDPDDVGEPAHHVTHIHDLRSEELLIRFMKATDGQLDRVRSCVHACCKGFSQQELNQAIQVFTEEASVHLQENDCAFGPLLMGVVDALKQVVAHNLQ